MTREERRVERMFGRRACDEPIIRRRLSTLEFVVIWITIVGGVYGLLLVLVGIALGWF